MTIAQRFEQTGSAYDLPEPHFDADLARVGRGTPMGELLRRYWHPVFKSETLKDLPVQVRALGEDIVLFRKPSGEVGAVYPRCAHRGASLLYGRPTDAGLRCPYHGWTFEVDGRCTDQPCEPDGGGRGRGAVRQPWYPAQERYGLVFVYQGPLDKTPPLPRYDLLESLPEGWALYADDTTIPSAGAGYMPCNWLQHHENGMDPHHVAIVHEHQFPPMMAKATSVYSFEAVEDRVRGRGISKIGPMMMDFRVELLTPNVRIIPNPLLPEPRPDGKADSVGWTLPKDDTDTMVFTVIAHPVGSPPVGDADLYDGKAWRELTFEEHQRFPGDFETQVGQGPITFHSEEHLVSSDKGIVYLRRLLRSGARDVAEGRDPPLAHGPAQILIETTSGVRMSPNPDYIPDQVFGDDPVAAPVSSAAPAAAPVEAEPAPLAVAPMVGAAERWALTMTSPMGDQHVTLIVSRAGEALAGVMEGGDGSIEIKDGRAVGDALSWKAALKKPMPMTLKFEVKVSGDTLAGTFKPGLFPASTVKGVRMG